MRLVCGVGGHGWFKGPGPKISACGIGKRAVGIADGDHGQFVARAGCASGWRGVGDDPDPWVRPGSEGGRRRARAGLRATDERGPGAGRAWAGLRAEGKGRELVGRTRNELGRGVLLGWASSRIWAPFLSLFYLSFLFLIQT